MTIKELFTRALNKIKTDNQRWGYLLFDFFWREFTKKMDAVNSSDWSKFVLDPEQPEAIFSLYEQVLHTLQPLARQLADINDDSVYEGATSIADTIREILNRKFGVELQEVEIMSPSKRMAEAGLLEFIEDTNGENMVGLTQKGEEAAREVENPIEREGL